MWCQLPTPLPCGWFPRDRHQTVSIDLKHRCLLGDARKQWEVSSDWEVKLHQLWWSWGCIRTTSNSLSTFGCTIRKKTTSTVFGLEAIFVTAKGDTTQEASELWKGQWEPFLSHQKTVFTFLTPLCRGFLKTKAALCDATFLTYIRMIPVREGGWRRNVFRHASFWFVADIFSIFFCKRWMRPKCPVLKDWTSRNVTWQLQDSQHAHKKHSALWHCLMLQRLDSYHFTRETWLG